MKNLILSFCLLFVAATATNTLSAQIEKGAKIEFTKEIHDYGTIKYDADPYCTFEFKNTGDAPLIIINVQSTCGCTVPTKPTEPIMPGMTGKIDVKYNMNPGPIRKTITVESNATNVEGGKIALKIKGEVIVKPEINILEKKKTLPSQ